MTGHAIIEQGALASGWWRCRCGCGHLFDASDQAGAVAAHRHHFEMVKAREVAAEGLPAARAALKDGRPPLRLVKGDG